MNPQLKEEMEFEIERMENEDPSFDWLCVVTWFGILILCVLFWGAVAAGLAWARHHWGAI